MRRTSRRMRLCLTALILELLFIWGNSALPGEVSSALSGWVGNVLSHIFPFGPGEGEGSGLLRKLAHLSEFACLGTTLWALAGMTAGQKNLAAPLSLLGGITAACVDETIQIFTPGRSSSLIDVWIDTFGLLLGIILALIGYDLIKRKPNFLKPRSKHS